MNRRVGWRKWRGLILGSFLIVTVFIAGADAASWTHSVTGGYDIWYLNGTTQKFRYNLTDQQWSHFSTVGSSWRNISATGRPTTFIGDGAWYDMGNGFKFQYSDGYNKGTFKDGLKDRLLYKYASGQWYHVGDTTNYWQVLGTGGHNGTFIGDGAWYDLGNGFTYKYSLASDKGTFKDGSAYRFLYNYATGQWYHSGDTLSWQALGNAALTGAFMGDGRWHDLGNGFDYQFSRGYHKGTFKGGNAHFLYRYDKHQWWHTSSTFQGSWHALSAQGLFARFVGDGTWHDLGNGWDYQYSIDESLGGQLGTFTDNYAWFRYSYQYSVWGHRSQFHTDYYELSRADAMTASFVGDGRWHDVFFLGQLFQYQYSPTYHKGTFTDSHASWLYKYHAGQWWHYWGQPDPVWQAFTDLGISARFVGSGDWVPINVSGSVQYMYTWELIPGYIWRVGVVQTKQADGTWSNTFTYFYDKDVWP